jgi:protein tyrosine phosphatase (PTP) superfamily phosphohydrolase (DUF442 family)
VKSTRFGTALDTIFKRRYALLFAAVTLILASLNFAPALAQDTCLLQLHRASPADLSAESLLPPFDRTTLSKRLSGEIANFDFVSKSIWRGAAPTGKGIAQLSDSGVKTIVDLRLPGLGSIVEERQVKSLGLNYIHIPLGFTTPPMAKIAEFLNLIEDPKNQPVFVHCRQGADRTGTLIGIFRIIHDHWSFEQAYAEMRSHHFKPWFANLKNTVASIQTTDKASELADLTKNLENKSRAVAAKSSDLH